MWSDLLHSHLNPRTLACFVNGGRTKPKGSWSFEVCENEIKDFLCNFSTHMWLALANTLCRVRKGLDCLVAIEIVIILGGGGGEGGWWRVFLEYKCLDLIDKFGTFHNDRKWANKSTLAICAKQTAVRGSNQDPWWFPQDISRESHAFYLRSRFELVSALH